MKLYNRPQAEKIWNKLFKKVKNEYFKVEVLQYYEEDMSPSLSEWLQGNRKKALKLLDKEAKNAGWLKGKKHIKATRVHVVDLPLSPYLLWEIEFYKRVNIPQVGEKIYLVPSSKVQHLNLPDGDFLIFDNKRVTKNNYDEKGVFQSTEVYEGREIKKFLKLKNDLLKFALPLEKFPIS